MNETPIQRPTATLANPVPTVPASLTRRLATAVVVANVVAAGLAAVSIVAMRRPEWWPALVASVAIATLCVAASVIVLGLAAGRTVDWLVTFVMGASAARLFVSLGGLLVATQGLKTPPAATAVFVCGFYVVTLVVESVMLARSVGPAPAVQPVGGSDA